jgi:hypothetical protein
MEKQNNPNKRGFIVVTCASLWLLKTILGGVIYATSAFFTRQYWDRWKTRTIKFFDIDSLRRNK